MNKQAPEFIKKLLSNTCLRVSSNSSSVVKELAKTIKTMKKSSTIDLLVEEMNAAVKKLKDDLKSLSLSEAGISENKKTEKTSKPAAAVPLMGMISMVSFASLQIEIASRIESIVEAVEELANLAGFELSEKNKQNQANIKVAPNEQNDEETVKTFQKV